MKKEHDKNLVKKEFKKQLKKLGVEIEAHNKAKLNLAKSCKDVAVYLQDLISTLKRLEEKGVLTSFLSEHQKIVSEVKKLLGFSTPKEPACPSCGADATQQSLLGEWHDGAEYRCDNCGNEFEFNEK